jgi:hypothetical protein
MDTTMPSGIWYIETKTKKLLEAQILTMLDFMKIFILDVEWSIKKVKAIFFHKNEK